MKISLSDLINTGIISIGRNGDDIQVNNPIILRFTISSILEDADDEELLDIVRSNPSEEPAIRARGQ